MSRLKKKWFYRLLFSYTPVFFVMVSVLLYLFYLDLNQGSKRQLRATNVVLARQSEQTLDSSLSAIENFMIEELANDHTLKLLFDHGPDPFTPYEQFLLTNKLDELRSSFPLVDSVYFYNEPRKLVLSRLGITPVDQFADASFILSMYPVGNTKWSDPRILKPLWQDGKETSVVTLVKSAPISSYKEGLMIVNVRVDAIAELLREMSRSEYGYLDLLDSRGISFFRVPDSSPELGPKAKDPFVEIVRSDYSKWYMAAGLTDNRLIGSFFFLTRLWIYVGAAMIIIGLGWLLYVTHRNYKPISHMVERILAFTTEANGKLKLDAVRDEMSFIQSALTNLMLETSEQDKRLKKDLQFRRKHLLQELLDGTRSLGADAWKQELALLELPLELVRPSVAVLEIDKYAEFVHAYSLDHQYLFKYVIKKMFEEVCQTNRLPGWMEWVESNRMALLLQTGLPEQEGLIVRMCEEGRSWVEENLQMTVSLGIGPVASDIRDLSFVYLEACQTIQLKATLGANRVIGYRDIPLGQEPVIYAYLQQVRELATGFRLGEPGWRAALEQIFDDLQRDRFAQREVASLLDYFVYQLQREMTELGDSLQAFWRETSLPRLQLLVEQAETVQEAKDRLIEILLQLEVGIEDIRSYRSTHDTIQRVKQFIEERYDDSNLSLERLSEEFGISPRYISRLFKEEYGETFISYVSALRIRKAKQLLETTDDPLQEIVERVGYLSASSFIRIFRKSEGITPGDYRKAKQTSGGEA